jgi:SNF2 family DNA or RNA helicase
MRVVQENGKFILHTDYSERFKAHAIGAHWNKKRKVWEITACLPSAEKIAWVTDKGDDTSGAGEFFGKWRERAPEVVPDLKLPPMRHQVRMVSELLHKKRLCFFCEMGTGKTAAVIGAAQELFLRGEIDLVLVVAPLSVLASWERQIDLFCNVDWRTVMLTGTRTKRIDKMQDVELLRDGLIGKYLIFGLINYEGLSRYEEQLLDLKPGLVVFDESTKIKNKDAKTTKSAIILGDSIPYATALTGTPISNHVGDLWSQCRAVSSDFLGADYWWYLREFALFGGFKNKQIVGTKDLPRLEKLLDRFSIRVRKDDVLELPERTWDTREIILTGEQGEAYTDAQEEFYFAVDAVKKHTGTKEESAVLIRNAIGRLLRCQQIAAGHCKDENGDVVLWPDNPKTEEIVNIVEQAGEQKVVIFSRFLEDLKMAQEALTKRGVISRVYTGEVSQEERTEIEEIFQDRDSDLRVVLAQVQTGGFGLDLTAGNICVFLTNWFSWHVRDQAESRVHRPGQDKNVLYIDLLAVDTVDETVLQAIESKKSISEILFGKKVHGFE